MIGGDPLGPEVGLVGLVAFLVVGLLAGVNLGGVERLRGNRGGVVLALLSGAFVLLFVGTLAEQRCTGASNDVIATVGALGWAAMLAAAGGLLSRMLYRKPFMAFAMSIPIGALVFVLSIPVTFILVGGDCLNPQ